jgi:hypothetical protein
VPTADAYAHVRIDLLVVAAARISLIATLTVVRDLHLHLRAF